MRDDEVGFLQGDTFGNGRPHRSRLPSRDGLEPATLAPRRHQFRPQLGRFRFSLLQEGGQSLDFHHDGIFNFLFEGRIEFRRNGDLFFPKDDSFGDGRLHRRRLPLRHRPQSLLDGLFGRMYSEIGKIGHSIRQVRLQNIYELKVGNPSLFFNEASSRYKIHVKVRMKV